VLARPSDWNSVHAVSFSIAGSDLPKVFTWENQPLDAAVTHTAIYTGGSSVYVHPVEFAFALDSGQFMVPAVVGSWGYGLTTFSATSTGSFSRVWNMAFELGIYSLATVSSTRRAETVWTTRLSYASSQSLSVNGTVSNNMTVTNAATISGPKSFDYSGGMTYGTWTASGTRSTNVSTAPSSFANSLIVAATNRFGASVKFLVPFASTLPAGTFIMAHYFSSTHASTTTRYNASQFGVGILGKVAHSFNNWVAAGMSTNTLPYTSVVPFLGQIASGGAWSSLATSLDMESASFLSARPYIQFGRMSFNG
jgi:hypothetical protein